MAFLGKTLTVYLGADTSKLRAGLNSADRSLSGFGSKLTSMVGPALIGAAAAAGAFAVSLAVDGVQAAIKEEAELAKLGQTLKNLGFSEATDQVNTFIDDLQYTAAVSDSVLRPSFGRLLTSTQNVAQAQSLLGVALDVSAGTGKSLETVTNALGRALDGNFGALSKLGAGIDSSIIKNKDLDGAVRALSTTFAGQATTAAGTLQGQMTILVNSFDELKEAFGKGFIDGLTGSGTGLKDLSKIMRDAQGTAQTFGETIGDASLNMLNLLNNTVKTAKAIDEFGQQNKLFDMPEWLKNMGGGLTVGFDSFGMVMGKVAEKTDKARDAMWQFGVVAANSSRTTDAINRVNAAIDGMGPAEDKAKTSTGGLSSAIEKMNPRLRAQIDLVKDLTSKVGDAGKALETARKEMNSWISTMAGNITSEINLGTAFEAMFNSEGEKTGQSLLDGFNKQITQAGIFGGYLKQLNSEGGPELRDAVAALGPEAGNKLAKEIIDQGLIPTLQSKLVDVQHMAETTAAEMVPPMLIAGVQSAAGYLMTMQAELEESSTLLEEMGRRMGKTLSEAMVAEIRAALAAAGVAQGGATSIMAGAPTPNMAQAQLIAGNPLMNGTAIMQAIQNAILQSDQRLGRTGQVLNA